MLQLIIRSSPLISWSHAPEMNHEDDDSGSDDDDDRRPTSMKNYFISRIKEAVEKYYHENNHTMPNKELLLACGVLTWGTILSPHHQNLT
jgi:hypothetical protein